MNSLCSIISFSVTRRNKDIEIVGDWYCDMEAMKMVVYDLVLETANMIRNILLSI